MSYLYLSIPSRSGGSQYDGKDRPFKLANESLEIIKEVFSADTKENYYHAKALAAIGKALLVKGEREKSEEVFLKA